MSLLELLSRFLEYLFVWLPRPVLIPKITAFVRWTLGRDPVLLKDWCVIIPLIHSHERIDLRVDATEFEPKNLWTKDGAVVAIGFAIVWRVSNPIRCAAEVNGLNEFVSRLGESVLPEFVGSHNLSDFKRRVGGGEGREWGANALLRGKLRSCFEPYGITVEEAFVNFTDDKVQTIKIIGTANEANLVAIQSESL